MADVYFEPPMAGGGTPADQLQTLYRYLWQMSSKLNEAMTSVTIEQLEPQVREQIEAGGKAAKQNEASYNTVKSLIIKTADVVRHEMDVIRTELLETLVSESELGDLEENLTATFEATARGVVQSYNYEGQISSAVGEYRNEVSGYIFSGQIDTDPDTGNPVYGIAIGQNVTKWETDPDTGEPVGTLNDANKFATFTANELAFYVNGAKAAWFSNSVFNIAKGQILESMQMGTRHIWKIMNDHLALMSLEEQQAEE